MAQCAALIAPCWRADESRAELAWSRQVARVWVHTCTLDHPSALAFYQRSGFRAFRHQIEIADDPRLDGTLARSAAKHVPIIE